MSAKTAIVHVTRIMRKLGATNRAPAVCFARQDGIDAGHLAE